MNLQTCLLLMAFLTSGFTELAFAGTQNKKPGEDRLRKTVMLSLPPVLRKVDPGHTTRSTVNALLGKPMKGSTERDSYYRVTKPGKISDTTVGFADKKVRYVLHQFSPGKKSDALDFNSLKDLIPKDSIEMAKKKLTEDSTKPEGGRSVVVEVDASGLILRFSQSDSAQLQSVIVWKPGEKRP